MDNRPIVFVITPFGEDFLSLYVELSNRFDKKYRFTNAGDLDNQQNIIKDIVQGINRADIVIADLTGLNPNVFYELGLAHAMNKKVIIITQDISELPFDIKSYRANEYSLQFNKLPALIIELEKLLDGAISGEIGYGNPVSDYIPDFFFKDNLESYKINRNSKLDQSEIISNVEIVDTDKGYLDFIDDINEASNSMNNEIVMLTEELSEMVSDIANATTDIKRLNSQGGASGVKAIKGICRRLAEPVGIFNEKLYKHIGKISEDWENIENDYLLLLDNKYMKSNVQDIKQSLDSLEDMKNSIKISYLRIEEFRDSLDRGIGMERRLTRSMNDLRAGLEKYLNISDTMISSIDRIKGKSQLLIF